MRIAILAAFPLHLIPGWAAPPPKGHYATWLPQLSEAFAKEEGVEIHWVIATREDAPEAPVSWRNQFFHVLRVPGRFRSLLGYRREVAALQGRVREIAPDLVHAWGTEDCYGLAGSVCGKPWLLSMQGILGEYIRRSRMHPLVRWQAWWEKKVLRRAREISVESHWGRQVLLRLAPHAHFHLVEYGVQDLFFGVAWSPDPAAPVAVFAGTPDRRKGLPEALAAFADPALQNAELQILGDDRNALARRLKMRSTPNVKWLGRKAPAEIAKALSRAWCLVLPTRADTSPNVVKEARVIGLPVVTTPHGGQSDYIAEGENGYLVEPDDRAGLVRALTPMLTKLELVREMGGRRWEQQREFFRPEHTARKFLALYRQLTSAP